MGSLGVPELLIILAVVVLIFGVGRISKIGGELGKGIKAFREGVNEGKGEGSSDESEIVVKEDVESETKA
ncbi:MAG TPA: twin-arginine translocase TatA/TatE family subunit [Anaerolineae bacterium]|nr:twin-arginine translocase TatA/TatE family subunit [Anaerolineae bacterium]